MADIIGKHNICHYLEKRSLLIAVNCVAGLAIFFFGYDQGMMGSVNVSIDYAVNKMKFGHVNSENQVEVDNTLLQGGIVSLTQDSERRLLTSYRIRYTISVLSSVASSVAGLVRKLDVSRRSAWPVSGLSSVLLCKLLL